MNDILLDETGDLKIQNGDFVVGNSDIQDAILIVNAFTGDWKNSPTTGVGLGNYLGSSGQKSIIRQSIIQQLQREGFINIEVTVTDNNNGMYEYNLYAERNA